jgi:hypothetical protein
MLIAPCARNVSCVITVTDCGVSISGVSVLVAVTATPRRPSTRISSSVASRSSARPGAPRSLSFNATARLSCA